MQALLFSPAERAAIAHRMSLWDVFEQVFADTEGLEHLAPYAFDRARDLCFQLEGKGPVLIDSTSELDRELFIDCCDGSTWVAVNQECGYDTPASRAAYAALRRAARKIELAFDLPADSIFCPGE